MTAGADKDGEHDLCFGRADECEREKDSEREQAGEKDGENNNKAFNGFCQDV